MRINWRVLLLASSFLAFITLSFLYGVGVGKYGLFPYDQIRTLRDSFNAETRRSETRPDGRWERARESPGPASLDRETLDRLSTLGYLRGYTSAENAGGVTVLDARRVQHGLTLFTSGHAPVAYLVSQTGEVIHQWGITFDELWPRDLPFETGNRGFIRRAKVFPNGDLLAVFEYAGIFKLDRDSNVLWKSLTQNHHDFAVGADGSIVTLVRRHVTPQEMARKYPGFRFPSSGIFDDEIVILDPAGGELRRVSLFEAFYRSEYAPVLSQSGGSKDVFHANSVHIVEGRQGQSPIANGEILVSLRELNAVVSVDIAAGRVSWMLSGKWRAQHQAQLLSNGNILLLDNLGGNRQAPLKLDQSEILEFNPLSQEVVWRYGGSDESPFFTPLQGYVQRLENGNTLVTETFQGRIFEVSREGRIVWEYLNPHRAGDEGKLIASVMGARRVRPEDLEFLKR